MESQPQNPEFRNNPEKRSPMLKGMPPGKAQSGPSAKLLRLARILNSLV